MSEPGSRRKCSQVDARAQIKIVTHASGDKPFKSAKSARPFLLITFNYYFSATVTTGKRCVVDAGIMLNAYVIMHRSRRLQLLPIFRLVDNEFTHTTQSVETLTLIFC